MQSNFPLAGVLSERWTLRTSDQWNRCKLPWDTGRRLTQSKWLASYSIGEHSFLVEGCANKQGWMANDWINGWWWNLKTYPLWCISFVREVQDLLYSFVSSNSTDDAISTILVSSNVTDEDVNRLREQLTPFFPANYRWDNCSGNIADTN